MSKTYDTIIGLEIHAELKTKSKMFCACDNNSEGRPANSLVCPICLGHPGTLPRPNRQAIIDTLAIGLSINGDFNRLSKFDRKNYFYPDLPKGYQISQYDLPLVYGGFIEANGQRVDVTRIHLEEDTGKLLHPKGADFTLIDFNRAGTPLVELVTEPVIKNAETAKKFCQKYQELLRYLNLSDADMEKGQMRCEANISVQEKGKYEYSDGQIKALGDYKLNPKVEVKNINSFRAVEKAIIYETKRQIEALETGEALVQETRGWNEDRAKTISQRIKETSADYRYFPEPDIPPLVISDEMLAEAQNLLPELPEAKRERFLKEYQIRSELSDIIISNKHLADYFEQTLSELEAWILAKGNDIERQKIRLANLTANWLTSELLKHEFAIYPTPENFAELLSLIAEDKINSSAGQTILNATIKTKNNPTALMQELGLEQSTNSNELEEIAQKIITKFPDQTNDYRGGKTPLLQFFVGQMMAETKGKANPKIAAEILSKLLK